MRLCCRASDGAPLQEPLGLQIALLNIQAWNPGKLLAYKQNLLERGGRRGDQRTRNSRLLKATNASERKSSIFFPPDVRTSEENGEKKL